MSQEKRLLIQGDSLPNILRLGDQDEFVKKLLLDKYEAKLTEIIERYRKLPAILVHYGQYSGLLIEARQLYLEGNFYSCIAMCGVTAESIAKLILRNSILFKKQNEVIPTSEEASKSLDRIDMDTVRRILISTEIIDHTLNKPLRKLAELRNQYVHRIGSNPEEDSEKAINYLHEIIEGTVSVFRDFTIDNGKLVLK